MADAHAPAVDAIGEKPSCPRRITAGAGSRDCCGESNCGWRGESRLLWEVEVTAEPADRRRLRSEERLALERLRLALDAGDVECGDFGVDPEQTGEARLRAAAVAADELFDVEAAGAVDRQLRPRGLDQLAVDPVDGPLAGEGGPAVVDPPWRVLLDGRPVQLREGGLEARRVDGFVEGHVRAVAFARLEFLDPLDHVVSGQPEPPYLDSAVGRLVYPTLEPIDVRAPLAGSFDLEDERPSLTEGPCVDVLAAGAVEDTLLAVHRLDDVGSDESLDAGVVQIARPPAVLAGLLAVRAESAPAPGTLPAGPLGLGDPAFELAVAAVDERGVDPNVDGVARHLALERVERAEVDDRQDVRTLELDLGAGERTDPTADLAVDLPAQALAGLGIEPRVLPEQPVVLLDERGNPTSDLVAPEGDALELRDDRLGYRVERPRVPLTDPAVGRLRGLVGLVGREREGDPQRPPALPVFQPEAPVGERAAQTGVTDGPRLHERAGLLRYGHGSPVGTPRVTRFRTVAPPAVDPGSDGSPVRRPWIQGRSIPERGMDETRFGRRRLLAGAGTGLLAAAAGCVAPQSGTPVSFESNGSAEIDRENVADGSAYTEVYEAVIDSVTLVRVLGVDRPFDEGEAQGQGSAFLIDGSHAVTNEHVVAGGEDVELQYVNGDWTTTELVGTDFYSDLAVVEVEHTPEAAGPLALTEEYPVVGQEVLAVGNPLGLEGSMTQGIVSGVDRSLEVPATPGGPPRAFPNVVQFDAGVNPGNSGGPLVNLSGEVVGVVNAGGGDNIGFAVSAALTRRVVPSLIETGEYAHPYMGVVLETVDPTVAAENDLEEARGVIVVDVEDGSPADGVLRGSPDEVTVSGEPVPVGGDVVLAMDGTEIPNREALSAFLTVERSPGDELEVEIVRDGERTAVDLTLGERPEPQ